MPNEQQQFAVAFINKDFRIEYKYVTASDPDSAIRAAGFSPLQGVKAIPVPISEGVTHARRIEDRNTA